MESLWRELFFTNMSGTEYSSWGHRDADNTTIPGDCELVHSYNWSDRCYFVNHNRNCMDDGGFVDYLSVLYCSFSETTLPLAIILYSLWLLVLFIALAVSADDFFCPAIEVISATLKLSQNIAGVTIMALGNGAPDIFSALAGISASRPKLVFGGLFGAGMFVTTFVAGSVCLTKPFKVMERPFLRDVTFYLMASFWAFYIFYRNEIRVYDAVGFLGLYIVYIAVVVVGRYIHNKIRTTPPYSPQVNEVEEQVVVHHRQVRILEHASVIGGPSSETLLPSSQSSRSDYGTLKDPLGNPPEVRILPEPLGPMSVKKHVQRFLHTINPIQREEWTESNWFWRFYSIFKSPLTLVLKLTVPLVCPESPEDTWCQFLIFLQCFTTPIFAAFATGIALEPVGSSDILVLQIVLMCSPVLALIIAFTSRTSVPPVYNSVFAFIGFGVSVIWIYIIANELVTLLKAFGVLFGLSDGILGLTVLAWGNSTGDLIADTSIAKRGHPRTGFSACFGGPLFNLLLGIGLPFSILILSQGGEAIPVEFNVISATLSIGLGTSLLFSFLLLPCLKFYASRVYGTMLVTMYLVFLIVCIVVEFTLL